jgi:hypothetical protein
MGDADLPRGFHASLRTTLDAYRQAHAGWVDALKAAEQGNQRQQQATQARAQAIGKAVAEGKMAQQIWEKVGAVTFMDNATAREIAQAYEALVSETHTALIGLLDAHRGELVAWLESRTQPEAEGARIILERLPQYA